jgi:FKBP-type peptidyl-prolyl cis-trans isomerase FklB
MRFFTFFAVAAICLTLVSAAGAQDDLPAGNAPRQAAPGTAPGAAPAGDAEFKQQVSYALGRSFAQQMSEMQVDVDIQSLIAGITDALKNAPPKYTDAQLGQTMDRFRQEMQQKMIGRMKAMAAQNQKEADAFLAQNAKREGIQTTPSGLQYRVIRAGEGASPMINDTVRCNYKGTLLNGTEFDNSQQNGGPVEFQVVQAGPGQPGLIEGWVEALQKMKVGEKWQLFVPPQLAYKTDPPGPPIEPNSLLVFEIELVEIVQP